MKKDFLSNNIPFITKINEKTPRITLSLFMEIKEPEKKAGVYFLMNRLFLQGTKNRTAENIARELEENAIECFSEMKFDYLKFSITCLNENFEKALQILSDIVENTHFKSFEKEVYKFKGELTAELDSPKNLAMATFVKNIFANHFYGNSILKIFGSILLLIVANWLSRIQ